MYDAAAPPVLERTSLLCAAYRLESGTGGLLDDTWFNRTFWMYSANWPGWYHAHRGAKSGQLLVMGPERTFALQAFPTRNRQSPLFNPGGGGYLLVADDNDTQ